MLPFAFGGRRHEKENDTGDGTKKRAGPFIECKAADWATRPLDTLMHTNTHFTPPQSASNLPCSTLRARGRGSCY